MRRDWKVIAFSIAMAFSGALLIYRGFTTEPGRPAVEIPMRPDWSATEAKVIGGAFITVGIYGLLLFSRRRA